MPIYMQKKKDLQYKIKDFHIFYYIFKQKYKNGYKSKITLILVEKL